MAQSPTPSQHLLPQSPLCPSYSLGEQSVQSHRCPDRKSQETTFILEEQRREEFAGSHTVSPWSSQDGTLSAQTLTPMPPTCLCEPDGGLTPFSSPLPGPQVPWGPGSDGHGPFQTTVEIFCLGQTRIRPGPQVRHFQSYAKGRGCVSGARSGHFNSTTAQLWDFTCVVGVLWPWWASKLWVEASKPHLPGPSRDHAPRPAGQLSCLGGQQVDFPHWLRPHTLCDPGWVSSPDPQPRTASESFKNFPSGIHRELSQKHFCL